MKLRFRATLMTILLLLIIITVSVVGVSSYLNARRTAEDLSSQILNQASLRVSQYISNLLGKAARISDMNRDLLLSGQLSPGDFTRIARYWVQIMKNRPELTYLSLALQSGGDYVHVTHTHEGKLSIRVVHRNPTTGQLELRDYWPQDFPRKPYYVAPCKDARTRPYYTAAQHAGRQTWTETYIFLGSGGTPDVPGVTCATPVYLKDGSLLGVLTADFDLYALGKFLQSMRVGEHGYSFVVEIGSDGTRRVIGHPKPELLLRIGTDRGNVHTSELAPAEEVADPMAQAAMIQVHPPFPHAEDQPLMPVRFNVEGNGYIGGCRQLEGERVPHWLIYMVIPTSDILARVERSNLEALVIGLAAIVCALLLGGFVSIQVARPLECIDRETAKIGRLDFKAQPVQHSIVAEVDRLGVTTEATKASLRSFEKYVPTEVVAAQVLSKEEVKLGGKHRVLSIYFSDIESFTSVSERLSPDQLVELLGEYLGALTSQIQALGGVVDKYIGDAIMAYWEGEAPWTNHALAACTTALRNQETLADLRQKWSAAGKPAFKARIGLNTGEVVIGNIGSDQRMNYTIIGDSVNLASRLEGLNKYYGTCIMISETTYEGAREGIVARPLDWVSVKGKAKAVLVYELLGLKGEVPQEKQELVDLFIEGLGLYRKGEWTAASMVFEQVLQVCPDDYPAQLMINRCKLYQAAPPGNAWDGVHRMEQK